jgi:hypothetical protein
MAKVPYANSRFQLTIEGQPAYVNKFDGGNVKAELVEHKNATTNITKKTISTMKTQEVSMDIGAAMGKPLQDWIQASINMGYVHKDLELASADANGKIQSIKNLFGCHITELSLKACDAASKDSQYFTVKASVERTRVIDGDGKSIQGAQGKNKQKNWLCSMFRFELAGLEDACHNISKVDSLSYKQKIAVNEVGHLREYQKVPAAIEFSNIKLTIAAHDMEPWRKWHEEFVINGKNGDEVEKTGALTFLDNSGTVELGSIEFHNCGIIDLKRDAYEASGDKLAKFTVELYTERWVFNWKVHD